jgi:hypothetical protein
MPVMFAGTIGDISVQNVPHDATLDQHVASADTDGDIAE